jgi:DNA-binding transcriptional LysR family regulator
MPLSGHVPDLPALELLLEVGARGSIGAAARVQGISQQVASARLRRLEGLVGLTLLDRRAAGSTLTDAGRAVAAWAGRVVAAATELDDGVAALRRAGAARLRLAASMTVGEQLIPRWLVALRNRAPAGSEPPTVTLDVTDSDTVLALARNRAIDLGFVEGPDPPADLEHRVVGADRLVLVVAPDHPWAGRRRPVTAAQLAATPLVARAAGSGTRGVVDQALRSALGPATPLAPPAMEFATAGAVREAVRAGLAPAVLSSLVVDADVHEHRLAAVRLADVPLTRRLYAVWAGTTRLPPGPARDLLAIATLVEGRTGARAPGRRPTRRTDPGRSFT